MARHRRIIFAPGTEKALKRSGVSDDAIVTEITAGRTITVPKTGGVQKIRCAPKGQGKRGGVRVVLADYPGVKETYVFGVLSKSDREDFTSGEYKQLRELKRQIDNIIHTRR